MTNVMSSIYQKETVLIQEGIDNTEFYDDDVYIHLLL